MGAGLLAGRYRLSHVIGRGGFGEVWEAHDTLANRAVAVKRFDTARDGLTERRRVRREIAVLRALRLPGVVALYDEGEDEGRPFLVMERVAGRDFPGRSTPCPWSSLEALARALVGTLAGVHAVGVLHRDLKPSNVLVSESGGVTVLDFGIARFTASGARTLSADGALVGTPDYLAPEQLAGGDASERSDLYALGVMLYEALTGALPFPPARGVGALYARLTESPVPVRERCPEAPAPVAAVIDRLLARDPDARPSSAGEVLAALRGEPLPERDARPWLGDTRAIDTLAALAREGLGADVVGTPGSGRSRLLREAARRIEREGREAVWAVTSRRAFESLGVIAQTPGLPDDASLEHATEVVAARLGAFLARGGTLFVDDEGGADPCSRGVIARCDGAGAILRARARDAPPSRARQVACEPLDEVALRALFTGNERILRLRSDAARALWSRSGGVPREVWRLVDRWVRAGVARRDGDLLAIDRASLDRLALGFADAAHDRGDAEEALRNASHEAREVAAWVALDPGEPWSVEALAEVAAMPRWRVEAELGALEARGVVRQTRAGWRANGDASVTVEPARQRAMHRAMAARAERGTLPRWAHLARAAEADTGVGALLEEAPWTARQLAERGDLGQAAAVIEEALHALWSGAVEASSALEDALVALCACVALADLTPRAVDRALYALGRAPTPGALLTNVASLLRASLAAQSWTPRALELADAVAPFASVELERRRQGVRVAAARRHDIAREETVMAEVLAWADVSGDPEARADAEGWLGRLRYRQARYLDAAAAHREAARGQTWASARVASELNAASALLEAGSHREALTEARAARERADVARHGFFVAKAWWVLRAAQYRLGEADAPDVGLVDAAGEVSSEMEGFLAITEAAVAWRGGMRDAARALANRASAHWHGAGATHAWVIARALAVACGEPATEDARREVVVCAARCEAPGIGLQALALVAEDTRRDAGALDAARDFVRRLPADQRALRREVLSVGECEERLGLTSGG